MSRSKRVIRNVGVTLATQLLSWALSFAVTCFLPRYLGAEKLGLLTLAGSFVGLGGLIVTLGTSTVLVRDIARDHASARRLVASTTALRLLLWPVSVVVAVTAAYLLHYQREVILIIAVAMTATVVVYVNDAFSSALRGLEEIPRQNLASLVEKVLTGLLTITAVLLRAPLWCIVLTNAAGAAVAFTLNWNGLKPFFAAAPEGEPALPQRQTVQLSYPREHAVFVNGDFRVLVRANGPDLPQDVQQSDRHRLVRSGAAAGRDDHVPADGRHERAPADPGANL